MSRMKTTSDGFTLIEIMIAMMILSVSLLGFFQLSNYTISQINSADQRLMAMNYATEGLEIVRNIRDSLVEADLINGWNEFLAITHQNGVTEYTIELGNNGYTLKPITGNSSQDWELIIPIKESDTELTYLPWQYHRRLVISDGPSEYASNLLKVSVDVAYEQRGIEDSISLTSYLGNIAAIR